MIKRLVFVCLLAAAATVPAVAADVGVSVSIGQPGFYGRIDVGNYPQPVLVSPQPVVIVPAPYATVQQPIYLRVPPGHQKNWAKHCGRYGACGQRMYFVQDNWYRDVYAPRYREEHSHGGRGRDDDRRGPPHGKGHGKGKGHD